MNEPIVSRDAIREKARRAFAAGEGRDSHNMNWHASALKEWQDEWDRQYAAWTQRHKKPAAGARA